MPLVCSKKTVRTWRALCWPGVVCCVVMWLLPHSALADMAKAQVAYSLGFDAYKKKSYGKAHRHFRVAYREAPSSKAGFRSVLLYFSGMCQFHLQRWSGARSALRQFVRSGKGRATHRANAMAALRKTEAKLRRLAAIRRAQTIKAPRPARRRARPIAVYTPPRRVVPRPVTPRRVIPRRVTPRPVPLVRALPRPVPVVRKEAVVVPSTRVALNRQPQAPKQRSGPSPVAYLLIGLGGAAALTGGVLVGVALGAESTALATYEAGQAKPANERPPAQDVIQPLNNARTMSYASYALGGGGVALVATGLIVFFATKGRPVPTPPRPVNTTTQLRMFVLFP